MALDILIVDDEADIRVLTSGILEDEGHQTRQAHDSASVMSLITARRPSLVLLDIWLEGSELDGMQILEVVSAEHPDVPVVMMSGHGTVETAVAAMNLGAYDFIEKPFTTDRMISVVNRAMETANLKRENLELRRRAGWTVDLVGKSAVIAQLRQTIQRVAPANSRVLITGPAGSGKEVMARLLHDRSNRAAGPFVVLNCATMRPEGLEIGLFGKESPENGGTEQIQIGTFEQAHNGTLFLDEVADMPIETQGKIVRVLQEQTFQRVGGATRVEVDVRMIAASSRDLAEEMKLGGFREDLFYRLSVVPVEMPPLREYREDIPALAEYFMVQTAEAIGQTPRKFAEDALAALQTYDWPGNVRELRNVIERLLIMAPDEDGGPIRSEMIPTDISQTSTSEDERGRNMEIMGMPLREAREIFERDYLSAQVARFGGNISRTATFVGMERSALHRKLKTLGISTEDRPQRQ